MVYLKRRCKVLSLTLMAIFSTHLYAQDYFSDSEITDVTVYSNQAIVKRHFTVDVAAGDANIILKNLPQSINPESIQIAQSFNNEALKPAKFIDFRLTQQEYEKSSALIEKHNALVELQKEHAKREAEVEQIKGRINFIQGILNTAKQIPSGTPRISKEDLELYKQLYEELPQLESTLFEASNALKVYTEEFNQKSAKLQTDIAEIERNLSILDKSLAIEYAIPNAGKLDVVVTYAVTDAAWGPQYELRMNDNQLDLRYQATIQQRTGETWQNVNLSLSTTPPLFEEPSPLYPWTISLYTPSAKVDHNTVRAQGAPAIQADMISKMESEQSMQMYQTEPANTVEAQGVNVLFNLGEKVTVKGDSTPAKVTLLEKDFDAAISREITAYSGSNVGLFANLENTTEYPWLAGMLNIFIDDQFIAKNRLDMTLVNEKLKLFLGNDPNIKLTQAAPERFKDTSWSKHLITETRKTTIENTNNFPVTLVVNDLVPVSADDKITIDYKTLPQWLKPYIEKPLTEADAKKVATIKDSQGILRGEIQVEPKKSFTYELKYEVTYPEQGSLIGF